MAGIGDGKVGHAFIKDYKNRFFGVSFPQIQKDLVGGIIVALVSIPISMGYAQIAGLPMQYGLYGSVFPILLFGLLTTTRDFVFGVDAAPAALVGAAIAEMGIIPESPEAVIAVPTIAFFVAGWLMLFYLLKAGRVVKYISSPVMGGFVTGICCTIILMQTPKLFGGKAGMGEAPELILHIIEQTKSFSVVSLLLSAVTIALIMLGKRFIPKVPVSVIVLIGGAVLSRFVDLEAAGVALLPHVNSGFPGFHMLPAVDSVDRLKDYLFSSLSIAAVILAESLLASRGNAIKDGYRLGSNREILAYATANLASALSGCLPVNGSVSRTGIVRQFGAKTQWMSVGAALSMLGVLWFGTFIIEWLPVPVLTAIVVSALINACDFHEAVRLIRTSRNEFYIFAAAMLGVLLLGTVYGVMVGVILSFVAVIIRAVTPPRAFMGVIRGRDGFYSLDRSSDAKPIRNTVIYRFGGNLFFANIDTLTDDIEGAVNNDTKVVVINSGAVGSIDVTTADRLVIFYDELKKRGIKLYIAGHVGEINDLLRKYGASRLLRSGCVRMTVELALRDAGLSYPYPIEDDADPVRTDEKRALRLRRAAGSENALSGTALTRSALGIQAELEWALGIEAGSYMERISRVLLEELESDEGLDESFLTDAEKHTPWGRLNFFDEDELIDRIEMKLFAMKKNDPRKAERLEGLLEKRREHIERRMLTMDPQILARLKKHRLEYGRELEKADPEAYARLRESRKAYIQKLHTDAPELAARYEEVYSD